MMKSVRPTAAASRFARASALLAFALCQLSAGEAVADPPEIVGQAGSDAYAIVGEQANKAHESVPQPSPVASDAPTGPVIVEYRWIVACAGPGTPGTASTETDCPAARVCADANDRLYRLWGRTENPPSWLPLSTRCFGEPPTAADTPRPRVTPALVLNEIRRIGLPTLQARTQPEGKTLVNFDTIFYTEAPEFVRTITLLGQQVDVVAEAVEYTWYYGDGGFATTATPGAPYPSKEITYRYAHAGTTVRPRVDVTYSARFRVNGGAWQSIPETVTIAGPEGDLRVSEARAVLSGDYG